MRNFGVNIGGGGGCGVALPDKKCVVRKERKDAWKTKTVYEVRRGIGFDVILVLRAMLRLLLLLLLLFSQ